MSHLTPPVPRRRTAMTRERELSLATSPAASPNVVARQMLRELERSTRSPAYSPSLPAARRRPRLLPTAQAQRGAFLRPSLGAFKKLESAALQKKQEPTVELPLVPNVPEAATLPVLKDLGSEEPEVSSEPVMKMSRSLISTSGIIAKITSAKEAGVEKTVNSFSAQKTAPERLSRFASTSDQAKAARTLPPSQTPLVSKVVASTEPTEELMPVSYPSLTSQSGSQETLSSDHAPVEVAKEKGEPETEPPTQFAVETESATQVAVETEPEPEPEPVEVKKKALFGQSKPFGSKKIGLGGKAPSKLVFAKKKSAEDKPKPKISFSKKPQPEQMAVTEDSSEGDGKPSKKPMSFVSKTGRVRKASERITSEATGLPETPEPPTKLAKRPGKQLGMIPKARAPSGSGKFKFDPSQSISPTANTVEILEKVSKPKPTLKKVIPVKKIGLGSREAADDEESEQEPPKKSLSKPLGIMKKSGAGASGSNVKFGFGPKKAAKKVEKEEDSQEESEKPSKPSGNPFARASRELKASGGSATNPFAKKKKIALSKSSPKDEEESETISSEKKPNPFAKKGKVKSSGFKAKKPKPESDTEEETGFVPDEEEAPKKKGFGSKKASRSGFGSGKKKSGFGQRSAHSESDPEEADETPKRSSFGSRKSSSGGFGGSKPKKSNPFGSGGGSKSTGSKANPFAKSSSAGSSGSKSNPFAAKKKKNPFAK